MSASDRAEDNSCGCDVYFNCQLEIAFGQQFDDLFVNLQLNSTRRGEEQFVECNSSSDLGMISKGGLHLVMRGLPLVKWGLRLVKWGLCLAKMGSASSSYRDEVEAESKKVRKKLDCGLVGVLDQMEKSCQTVADDLFVRSSIVPPDAGKIGADDAI
ncbi:hypothetical protein BLNAU_19721 [Blattamonas nauphoetae]|uniref:Uncharacterized protein n=1 Tax=Blattamonas nauphoetae TaxID=2049346 RepID=A0ABQ9X0M5_9EUKA|nr:hypothetical protein BLNAU_19721 [Blattamonas nauphoetae]